MESENDDTGHCRMADNLNLYNIALTIIKRKGFEIFLRPNSIENTSHGTFFAKKGNRNFNAEDPLRLLGMITIWEIHGDDWYKNKKFPTKDVLHGLLSEAYPDSSKEYIDMEEEQFLLFVKKCQDFFKLGMFPGVEIKDTISRIELSEIIRNLKC